MHRDSRGDTLDFPYEGNRYTSDSLLLDVTGSRGRGRWRQATGALHTVEDKRSVAQRV